MAKTILFGYCTTLHFIRNILIIKPSWVKIISPEVSFKTTCDHCYKRENLGREANIWDQKMEINAFVIYSKSRIM